MTFKHQRCELLGGLRGMPPGKILKSGPLRMHFQRFAAKIRVFEQNTGIIKFWLFGGGGVISKEKLAASQREIASKFSQLPALTENPVPGV